MSESTSQKLEALPNDPLVGQSIDFRTNFDLDSRGRESTVKVKSARLIGEGVYSEWVKQVDATVIADESESAQHSFVIKKVWPFSENRPGDQFTYHEEWASEGRKELIRNTMINHERLKKAGIQTLTTLRVSKDNSMLLMSDKNLDGRVLVSGMQGNTSHVFESFGTKISDIKDVERLMEAMYQCVIKAGKAGLMNKTDSYGFLIDEACFKSDSLDHGEAGIDFIIFDFDATQEITPFGESPSKNTYYSLSLGYCMRALISFIHYCVDESRVEALSRQVEDFFKSKLSK